MGDVRCTMTNRRRSTDDVPPISPEHLRLLEEILELTESLPDETERELAPVLPFRAVKKRH